MLSILGFPWEWEGMYLVLGVGESEVIFQRGKTSEGDSVSVAWMDVSKVYGSLRLALTGS